MKDAVRDARELCELLDLPPRWAAEAVQAEGDFPLFVSRSYLARIAPGDPHDPLLRQVLPVGGELDDVHGYWPDPVGDAAAALRPGLLQKYASRALLVATGRCAIHCRYCFRRHFPYQATPTTGWDAALAALADDPAIEEVILSGGDPLTLVDETLADLARRLAAIPHLCRLRVHTRLPVVIPQRVTDELLAWLGGTRLTPIVVVHVNHARELAADVADALARLIDAGIPLLNQAVLLRGVNDKLDDQLALCRRLVELRVMPYYLHQLDRVAGAAHFEVPVAVGKEIMSGLHARLPGYAVPRYVREVAGEAGKVTIV